MTSTEKNILDGKRILVTGGTGSLGKVLIKRLLSGQHGQPKKIIVFSRDETKQHHMRLEYKNRTHVTEEVIFGNFEQLLDFRIGDIRDYHSVKAIISEVDIIFNAAAMKQVPTCEYFPYEAMLTNITGAQNIVRAIREGAKIEAVIGVSTDKACKPVNVMGMTKAVQERVFINANLHCPDTRFICVRYGNVLASRGSVIPFFHERIRAGGPVTVTTKDMTRFLLSLDQAVDLIITALTQGKAGETFVSRIPSSSIMDLATVLIGDRDIKIEITGIRPGEKTHEILVSEEEGHRTVESGNHYIIQSVLPELRSPERTGETLNREFSSADYLMTQEQLADMLKRENLLNPEL